MTQQKMKLAVAAALERNDTAGIEALAAKSRNVLSILVRLAYDKTTVMGWRAIKAAGHVSSTYVRSNYEFLRDTIRKLLWSLSDESGGIGWSAPEILGEIVSSDPKKFADVIPLIAEVFTIEERVFRPGVLYALTRIAGSDPDAVCPFKEFIKSGIEDKDPLCRVHALELAIALKNVMNQCERDTCIKMAESKRQDKEEVWIYRNDGFEGKEVGEIACKVVDELSCISN